MTIGRRRFTFLGEDEERIKRVASFVDSKLEEVSREHGIVNTVNVLVMALMEVVDEYLILKEKFGSVISSTNRLLRKIEEV